MNDRVALQSVPAAGQEDRGRMAAGAPTDDILDTVEDQQRWPVLAEPLRICNEMLAAIFADSDRAALRHQCQHRRLTNIAAICGTAAVLFAIVQLSNLFPLPWLAGLESTAALAALVAVILGLIASRQARWLLERHKAECCRLLKFRFLTDPALWDDAGGLSGERVERFRTECRQIQELRTQALHRWIEEDEVPLMPPGAGCAHVPRAVREALADYYQAKRLHVQMDYFSQRARRNIRLDRTTRHLPPLFFFASVLAALGHFLYDLSGSAHARPAVSAWLVVLAAALPVVGTGVRTIRLAHEFARNTSRFRAKLVVLRRLAETVRQEADPAALFREFWCSEQVLESEHREWLRLMIEAEWFG